MANTSAIQSQAAHTTYYHLLAAQKTPQKTYSGRGGGGDRRMDYQHKMTRQKEQED